MIHQLKLSLPPGMTFNQQRDGSLKINYTVQTALKLRDALVKSAAELTKLALERIEADKKMELARQQLPVSKVQALDGQIDALKKDLPTLDPQAIDPSVTTPRVIKSA
jgi:hypothetical protein